MTMILTRLMSRSSLPSRKCDFIVVQGDCQHCSGGSTGAIACGSRVVMRGTSPTVREAQFVAREPAPDDRANAPQANDTLLPTTMTDSADDLDSVGRA